MVDCFLWERIQPWWDILLKWICDLLLKMEKLLKLLYGALRATVDNTLAGAQNLMCLGLILDELFHLAF